MTQPQPNEQTEQQEQLEQPNGEAEQHTDEPEQFPREYVHKLREEAAESRTALKDASQRGDALFESLKLRTLEAATGDLLRATSDMPADDERYYDNNGFPSMEGMREVAQEIISQKPYLAKPHGDIRQGPREEKTADDPATVLGGAIRSLL